MLRRVEADEDYRARRYRDVQPVGDRLAEMVEKAGRRVPVVEPKLPTDDRVNTLSETTVKSSSNRSTCESVTVSEGRAAAERLRRHGDWGYQYGGNRRMS